MFMFKFLDDGTVDLTQFVVAIAQDGKFIFYIQFWVTLLSTGLSVNLPVDKSTISYIPVSSSTLYVLKLIISQKL